MIFSELVAGFTITQLLIWAIIIAGAIAVVFVVFRRLSITIPDFVVQIFWIVVCVVMGVLAIKFLLALS